MRVSEVTVKARTLQIGVFKTELDLNQFIGIFEMKWREMLILKL